ncbi:hypothetical protein FRC17_008300 [Serendipita sp. 399]|nr:hypothetical protein FRC17_008300 [Serendipita sp. 399]
MDLDLPTFLQHSSPYPITANNAPRSEGANASYGTNNLSPTDISRFTLERYPTNAYAYEQNPLQLTNSLDTTRPFIPDSLNADSPGTILTDAVTRFPIQQGVVPWYSDFHDVDLPVTPIQLATAYNEAPIWNRSRTQLAVANGNQVDRFGFGDDNRADEHRTRLFEQNPSGICEPSAVNGSSLSGSSNALSQSGADWWPGFHLGLPVLTSSSRSTLLAVGTDGEEHGAEQSFARNMRPALGLEKLDDHTRSIFDNYLLRYLNHLCINPNATDRFGRRIHQQYTAKRIERDQLVYGWRPLKFRIEAFVNAFMDILMEEGLTYEVVAQAPSYLGLSNLLSRFNESGNRTKSQGQNIWRARARCRIGSNVHSYHPTTVGPVHPSNMSIGYPTVSAPTAAPNTAYHDTGRMLCDPPLLWEFLPFERYIVGQPPLAIVGRQWQWSLKLHDHWASRKKVQWKLIEADPESHPPILSWLLIRKSQLVGTPSCAGSYPFCLEATCDEEDGKTEAICVRGSFTINVASVVVWPNGPTSDYNLNNPNDDEEMASYGYRLGASDGADFYPTGE